MRTIYLKLREVLVVKLFCSIAVFVIQKLDLSCTSILRILNEFLAWKKYDNNKV